ncbi:MAG TPA: hypothetical protein VMJ65_21050 [Solirubrobacteraceae bacterium]|nr:hypothetical protein [Solirubrobacteraceae bacterium]
MRGQSQAVSARLPAVVPSRRWWSLWPAPVRRARVARERAPRLSPYERIAVIEQREAQERAALRSGRYVAEAAYLGRRW